VMKYSWPCLYRRVNPVGIGNQTQDPPLKGVKGGAPANSVS
jgi:hypothetical protein